MPQLGRTRAIYRATDRRGGIRPRLGQRLGVCDGDSILEVRSRVRGGAKYLAHKMRSAHSKHKPREPTHRQWPRATDHNLLGVSP